MIKKVYSLNKALQLKTLGNEWLFTEPNKKKPNFKVFVFEDTEKLNNDWKKLKQNNNKIFNKIITKKEVNI